MLDGIHFALLFGGAGQNAVLLPGLHGHKKPAFKVVARQSRARGRAGFFQNRESRVGLFLRGEKIGEMQGVFGVYRIPLERLARPDQGALTHFFGMQHFRKPPRHSRRIRGRKLRIVKTLQGGNGILVPMFLQVKTGQLRGGGFLSAGRRKPRDQGAFEWCGKMQAAVKIQRVRLGQRVTFSGG